MMRSVPETDQLLLSVCAGDAAARSQLLDRHRDRLRRMVAVRMDRRLAARVDPSDVIQDVLMEADRQLDDYARRQPLPFYPWLRQIAWGRMVALYRHHVVAQRRSVGREEEQPPSLPDESAWELANRLVGVGTDPPAALQREESRRHVQQGLEQLPEVDREILVLRHLEQLRVGEIAAILGISENTASARHLRALKKLREILQQVPLQDGSGKEQP